MIEYEPWLECVIRLKDGKKEISDYICSLDIHKELNEKKFISLEHRVSGEKGLIIESDSIMGITTAMVKKEQK